VLSDDCGRFLVTVPSMRDLASLAGITIAILLVTVALFAPTNRRPEHSARAVVLPNA